MALLLLFAVSGHGALPTKLGDLDGNNVLDVFDLTRLREHIRQTNPLAADLALFADVTHDGFVNEDDSVALINMIVGRDPAKPLPLAGIRETSPFAGESGVALTREVVVRFTMPLSLGAVLTTWNANTGEPGDFYAEAGGRKLLTRVELSGDRTKATLFFLETVPASTRVTVTFDGAGINDLLDRQIDPVGDNLGTGGVFTFTYDTAPITPVLGTGIIGKVFASEPVGADTPLEHVLVRVVGSETLFTFTAADGSFSLNPCPAGRFFVEVDGRTATASAFPNGDFYPYIAKAWEALPGKADNLAAGGTGKVYLPLVRGSGFKAVSATADTVITPPPAVVAQHPEMAGVQLDVPAHSLFSDDGTRGGRIVLAAVPSSRLPEPLPPGLNHTLDIAILTDGATNFDRPVPVKFPNLPDPVTGVKLKPGEKSALWSFNHDKGAWEIVGPMTVTDDGNFVVTDVGVGVRQPGWHGTFPGTPVMDGDIATPDDEEGNPDGEGNPREPQLPPDHPSKPGDDPNDDPPPPPPPEDKDVTVTLRATMVGFNSQQRDQFSYPLEPTIKNGAVEIPSKVRLTLEAVGEPAGGTYVWKPGKYITDWSSENGMFRGNFLQSSARRVRTHVTVEYHAQDGKVASKSIEVVLIPLIGAQWFTEFQGSESLNALRARFQENVKAFEAAINNAVDIGGNGQVIRNSPTIAYSATFRPLKRAYLMHFAGKIVNNYTKRPNKPPLITPATDAQVRERATNTEKFNPAKVDILDPFRGELEVLWAHYREDGSIDVGLTRRAIGALLSWYEIAYPAAYISSSGKITNHAVRQAIDWRISWQGTLKIRNHSGSEISVTGGRNPDNPSAPKSSYFTSDLWGVGATFGVNKSIYGDKPHWSSEAGGL